VANPFAQHGYVHGNISDDFMLFAQASAGYFGLASERTSELNMTRTQPATTGITGA
jgi:hypothetical protein